jgi:hypothetical protein
MPLLVGVQGESFTLLPVAPWHVGEYALQLPSDGLGDERGVVEGMDQFLLIPNDQGFMPARQSHLLLAPTSHQQRPAQEYPIDWARTRHPATQPAPDNLPPASSAPCTRTSTCTPSLAPISPC